MSPRRKGRTAGPASPVRARFRVTAWDGDGNQRKWESGNLLAALRWFAEQAGSGAAGAQVDDLDEARRIARFEPEGV